MKKNNSIGYFLREITIVVIGVLIAVSIGTIIENRDNKRYTEKTLQAIENEIKVNQADIDTVLTVHYEMLEKIGVILEEDDDGQTMLEFIAGLGGFQVASVKNVSLRFFISNKAELVEFDLISKLLDIESFTEILSGKIERLADFTYEHINDSDPQAKMTFAFMLSDVIESEEALLEIYQEFLEEQGALMGDQKVDS